MPGTQVAVKFHDMDNLEALLHVLQLMCEGHNLEMQEQLREQTGNIRQVNLVTLCVELLHVLVEDITAANIDVLVQVCAPSMVFLSISRRLCRQCSYLRR